LEKKVVWTDSAKDDLHNIYEFNSFILNEEKSFLLIEKLVSRVDELYRPIIGGTRYVSELRPEIEYQKLVEGDYLIIYRLNEEVVFVNRIFDSRQYPNDIRL